MPANLIRLFRRRRFLGLICFAVILGIDAIISAAGHAGEPERAGAPYTKLFLKQIIRVPFRLRFDSYDGDPMIDKPEKFSFGINTIDLRQPSEFLKIGEMISNTKFRVEKFKYKTEAAPNTEMADISEVTIVDTGTNERAVLILNRIVDFPVFFALLENRGTQPPTEFRVKKMGAFVLRPNVKDTYYFVGVKGDSVIIRLPKGQTAPNGGDTVEITYAPDLK